MVTVTVKWNGQTFELDVDPTQSTTTFKAQLWSQTNVPPERQKIMGFRGGILKDDVDISSVGLKEGMKIMMIGTSEGSEISAVKEPTIFLEDLTPSQRAILLKEKKIEPLPTGLVNLGTTCYLNSVIQFLQPVPELTDAISKLPGLIGSFDVDLKLCASFRELYKARGLTDEAIPPFLAVEALRARYPQFAQKSRNDGGEYMQQDAEECLSLLLDNFNRHSHTIKIDDLFSFTIEKTLQCKDNLEEPMSLTEEPCRMLRCHFGTQLSAVDHLHQGILLSLNDKMLKTSETLGKEAEYIKQLRMATLPKYLIVHFVRFEWKGASSSARTEAGRAKICRRVNFSPILDVYDFTNEKLQNKLRIARRIAGERNDSRQVKKSKTGVLEEASSSDQINSSNVILEKECIQGGQYELVSIVTHQGRSADSGHYVAWVKRDDEIWYKFDDDKVTECKWKNLDLTGGRSDYHIAVLLLYREILVETTKEEISLASEKVEKELQAVSAAAATAAANSTHTSGHTKKA